MGGIKKGERVVQGGMVIGTDVDLSLESLRGLSPGDPESTPGPAGELLGQDIRFKPELLGDPAVALVMDAFPGAEIVKG